MSAPLSTETRLPQQMQISPSVKCVCVFGRPERWYGWNKWHIKPGGSRIFIRTSFVIFYENRVCAVHKNNLTLERHSEYYASAINTHLTRACISQHQSYPIDMRLYVNQCHNRPTNTCVVCVSACGCAPTRHGRLRQTHTHMRALDVHQSAASDNSCYKWR